MKIVMQNAEESELPTLLHMSRHKQKCKTAHGTRKILVPPESDSTPVHSPVVSKLSRQSSKSFCNREVKSSEELASITPSPVSSDVLDQRCKAFPVKAAPLKRWRAAEKIQTYLARWRKNKGRSMSDPSPQVDGLLNVETEIAAPFQQNYIQHWPEEPEAPTEEDLEALTELESMLNEQHGTIAAAHKFIVNCVKRGSGNKEGIITKRALRIALCLKVSKESSRYGGLELMFDSLLRLLRRSEGDISKAEFLRFPSLLSREKDLRERATPNANRELLIGRRLQDRFTGMIKSSEDALELFQKAVVALELEPARTTNMFYRIASAPEGPSGLTSAMNNIMRIAQQFGGPSQGVKLNVLLGSWTLCEALARQVIALGATPALRPQSTQNQTRPVKPFLSPNVKAPSTVRFGKKCSANAKTTQPSHNDQNQKLRNECNMAFWQGLPTGEILLNLGCGAEKLDDEDFKTLLSAAWGLFDEFDAVGCLLGPVGLGRLRPKLDALHAMNLEMHRLGKEPEHARSQLQNAGGLLQAIASMCQADPRLARIAALFATSFLADRICSRANASVCFADGAVGSAAAQVNRSAAALTEELYLHVEELLGGRKVECCLSSGQYKIVPAPIVKNPLAEWQKNITAHVLAKATAKGEPNEPLQVEKCSLNCPDLQ